jgi:hypothetical protein
MDTKTGKFCQEGVEAQIVQKIVEHPPSLKILKIVFSWVFCLRLNIKKMAKTSQTVQLLGFAALGAVLLYALNSYSASKSLTGEGLTMDKLSGALGAGGPTSEMGPNGISSHQVGGNAQPTESLQSRQATGQSTYSESTLSASELLPKGEIGASWAAVNPAGMADLKGQNFLQAGSHTNTALAGVSQTNRNASWDVRSEAPNPQGQVGPFLNTTIETNPYKRGLDCQGLSD